MTMTIRKTARFAVDPRHIDEALHAIRTFVAHTRGEPGTMLYESWRSGERFLHLMAFAEVGAETAHATSDAVRSFTGVLYPLCTEEPAFEDWEIVEP